MYAEKKGFQIDEDDWFNEIAIGGKYTRSLKKYQKFSQKIFSPYTPFYI
jgi:hypothetical protein